MRARLFTISLAGHTQKIIFRYMARETSLSPGRGKANKLSDWCEATAGLSEGGCGFVDVLATTTCQEMIAV